jgi:signal peptidase complex subunit 3
MHTFLTRANALAAYTMSVLAGLTMVCFLSTFFLDYRTGSEINTVKVVVKHVPDYSASREKVLVLKLPEAILNGFDPPPS